MAGWRRATKEQAVNLYRNPAWALLFSLLLIVQCSSLSAEEKSSTDKQLLQQRADYKAALQALRSHDAKAFNNLIKGLKGYPLYPYVRYEQLKQHLSQLNQKEYNLFAKAYSETPLVGRLQQKWLKQLAKEKKWRLFLANYPSNSRSSSLNCYYAWALYQQGQKTKALKQAPALWKVGHSQSKSCDPLFAVWSKQGGITEDLAWQRFWLSYFNDNAGLARYVSKFLKNKSHQQQAQQALDLSRHPEQLASAKLDHKAPHYSRLVAHLIKRLVYRKPELAIDLWQQHQDDLKLSNQQKSHIRQRLGLYVLKTYHPDSAEWLAKLDPHHEDEHLLEWRLRYHLSQQDWQQIKVLLNELPKGLKNKDRWRYWQARQEETAGQAEQAIATYKQLANDRNFYGFLSAQRLGLDYQLNDQRPPVDPQTLATLATIPGIQRARELFYQHQLTDARIEWWRATQHFSKQQHYHAGVLAQRWGWLSQGISGAIHARQWDDIELRFPAPYRQSITSNASRHDIDGQWIFAVARQESAFRSDIRSPAGAIGLMQLMPRTARQTAKALKVHYRGSYQLQNPDTNIELGSAYLAKMYKRYQGNRVYATAAYNAGPSRVAGWLKDRGDLPIDIWIETIPFDETRQYVQNVLSYAVIYSDLLGKDVDFLKPNERPNWLSKH